MQWSFGEEEAIPSVVMIVAGIIWWLFDQGKRAAQAPAKKREAERALAEQFRKVMPRMKCCCGTALELETFVAPDVAEWHVQKFKAEHSGKGHSVIAYHRPFMPK